MNEKKIPVSNHYAFSSVFTQNLEVTRDFISVLIGREISKVTLAEKERIIDEAADSKGIRFDVYLKVHYLCNPFEFHVFVQAASD